MHVAISYGMEICPDIHCRDTLREEGSLLAVAFDVHNTVEMSQEKQLSVNEVIKLKAHAKIQGDS
ncbi:hypothetical protein T07_12800 [Trichinella nelsoni]|uniref:Uncharacterized protein n=1 Tax=Trichinella nelsoni TaxID=6336 RepID=A0A0V0SHW8_9BILA|nr:hypothetical protein T07_12800 [Trichinella nelsoni]